MKLTEELVNQLKALLEANMKDKIAELNAEYQDDLLQTPAAYYISEKDLDNVAQFPAIFILADSHDWRDEKQGIAKHKVIVDIGVMEQEEEKLQKKLMRFLRACIEIINADRQLATTAMETDFDRAEYTPMLVGADKTFLKDVFLELTIWTEEV